MSDNPIDFSSFESLEKPRIGVCIGAFCVKIRFLNTGLIFVKTRNKSFKIDYFGEI